MMYGLFMARRFGSNLLVTSGRYLKMNSKTQVIEVWVDVCVNDLWALSELQCNIDEATVFPRYLTPGEVEALYNE